MTPERVYVSEAFPHQLSTDPMLVVAMMGLPHAALLTMNGGTAMVPEQSSPFLQAGQLLADKYAILELLGEGGMGLVFAARHVDLDRKVAIKLIRHEVARHPGIIARLLAEARAAAQIRSVHVCQVLDVGRLDSGFPYIVMEYLEGCDLSNSLIDQKPVPESLAVDLLLEACEGVAEAHAVGIIHRDLKPENLFLARFPDGSSVLKVLDFGIAKVTRNASGGSLTLPGPDSGLGSPYYMAPEQMINARDVDERADIWALGAILYQLVTGQPPFARFDGDGLPALCAAVLQSEPTAVRELNPNVSVKLEQAILCCLRKERAQRFATVAQLAETIAPLGSGKTERSLERILRLSQSVESADADHTPRTTTPPRLSGVELVSHRERDAEPPPNPLYRQEAVEGELRPQAERRFRLRRGALAWAVVPLFLVIGGVLARSNGLSSRSSAASVQANKWGQVTVPLPMRPVNTTVAPAFTPHAPEGKRDLVGPDPIALAVTPAQAPSSNATKQRTRQATSALRSGSVSAAATSLARKNAVARDAVPKDAVPRDAALIKKAQVDPYDPSTFGGRW